MTTLNIGGKRVTVSDDFLKLSPEDQNATVDEIAKSLGGQGEPVGMAEDIARSAGAGVRRGIESSLGMFGDANNISERLGSWLAGKIGASPETQKTVGKVAKYLTPTALMPNSSDIRSQITDPALGESYEPQTTEGEFARTVGEFAPAAIAGPGGLLRKTANTIIPAMSSEAAGQLTKGTRYEPWARLAAALAGGGVSAVATPGKVAGTAIARATEGATPQQLDEAEALFQRAIDQGTPITRFEAVQQATGGATRAGDTQRVVEGAGGLRDFFAARPAQNEEAARQTFDRVTPATPDPSTIGPAAGRAAEETVNDTRQAINRVTEPLYTQAAPQRIDAATFQRVQAAPGWEEARAAIRNDPQLQRYVQGLPDDSVGFLNEVQKYLATQSENAAGAVNAQRNMQRSAGYGVDAGTVRTAAENASPEFAQALQAQAALRTQYLDPVLQGPLGKIAARDTTTKQAIEALFPRNPLPNSAGEIGQAVGQLSARNPWAARQLVRAHIESTFNQATKDLQSGPNQFGGAGFVANLRGNPQQAQNLEASIRALPNGDHTWQGFNRFLDIMEAQGTRQRIGSQTAFNAEALQDLRSGSVAGTGASLAVGGGLALPRKVLDVMERWRLGRNVDQIARLITDREGAKVFRTLAEAKGRGLIGSAIRLALMAKQSTDRNEASR